MLEIIYMEISYAARKSWVGFVVSQVSNYYKLKKGTVYLTVIFNQGNLAKHLWIFDLLIYFFLVE